jgi:hypothetical protein
MALSGFFDSSAETLGTYLEFDDDDDLLGVNFSFDPALPIPTTLIVTAMSKIKSVRVRMANLLCTSLAGIERIAHNEPPTIDSAAYAYLKVYAKNLALLTARLIRSWQY